MKKASFFAKTLSCLLLGFYFTVPSYATSPVTSSQAIILPNDSAFNYMGRMDTSTANKYIDLWWPGSTIETDFTGTSVTLYMEGTDPDDTQYLNVYIDNKLTVLKCEYGPQSYTIATGLTDTTHHLLINKRTEAWTALRFNGIALDSGASLKPHEDSRNLKIEFYGDSITAGVCNESEEGLDDYDDVAHYNNETAFSATLARKLNAQYSCIAVGGMGVVNGYLPVDMNDMWDATIFEPDSISWDFNKWQADYVVINLGQNDYSAGLEDTFTTEYMTLISKIRSKYPNAFIFCTIGPMAASHDASFVERIQDAVTRTNTYGDSKVYFHLLSQDSGDLHPRVAIHEAMADELADFINQTVQNTSK